jgi:hypothetical protein
MRGEPGFKGSPTLDWRIHGETSEIKVSCMGLALQMGGRQGKIDIFDYASNQVEQVSNTDDLSSMSW